MRELLNLYRGLLADYESVLAYAVLGVIGGIASGLVVLAFELAIGSLGSALGVADGGEGFEQLPRWLAFALPAAGAAVLGLAYTLLQPADRETGIVHVLSRMHSHYSVLPLRNAAVQFIGGVFALATGQSGGREGPGVHLGGAANSLLGQWLGLPNNSLRTLIACGTAGGIAAAFHTPLAGAVFAMEVIVAEYSMASLIPVLLAAVSAWAVSQGLQGGGGLFDVAQLPTVSLLELPWVVLLGLCCGIAVAAFIRVSHFAAQFSHQPVALRFAAAGLLTGSMALWVPEILGIGYDTLRLTLEGEIALTALLLIALCKLLATAVSCGVGMPVGLIGPSLLIGACIGGTLGVVGSMLLPELSSNHVLYIVIGMGAAMGAILNAPLAAILAVMELSQTISISMAAMLAIVVATLTNNGLFGQLSAHQTVLRQLRRQVPDDPMSQLLHSTAVRSGMDTRVVRVPALMQAADLSTLLEGEPVWCLVSREGEDLYLVNGDELVHWLEGALMESEDADVTEADIRRWTTAPVPLQATLKQALDTMNSRTTETVCVFHRGRATGKAILHGVVTRAGIEAFSLESIQ